MVQAVADPRLGGEVYDRLRPRRFQGPDHGGVVLEHVDIGREHSGPLKLCVTGGLEPDVVIGGHPVQAADGVPTGDQGLGQMEADEPGGSGHEHPQRLLRTWRGGSSRTL